MKHPTEAAAVFGDRLSIAEAYAESLATDGVIRGLIGPREVERIWDRHILNCAVLGELCEDGEYVIDIGSGAGLPGIPLAISRPEVRVTLIEPLLRRATYLQEFCDRYPALNITVVRGRAEEKQIVKQFGGADVVTSRAVSGFAKLAPWSGPLTRRGGRLLAVKGSRAAEEVEEARTVLGRSGFKDPEVVVCGVGVVDPPTVVVRAIRR